MSKESTIRDLRARAKKLEATKRQIDKDVEAIFTTLRIFENDRACGVSREKTSSHAQELTDTIFDILTTSRPLHRKNIFELLKVRGIHVGGQIPVNTVGSYLSTDDRFKNVGRGIWDLALPYTLEAQSLEEAQSNEELDDLNNDEYNVNNEAHAKGHDERNRQLLKVS